MHQQNITSCAKQELQPNMNQVKPIHFQEILSTSIDGQLVTNHLLSPPPKEKEEKKSVRLQYLKKKKKISLLWRSTRKTWKICKNYEQNIRLDLYAVRLQECSKINCFTLFSFV